MIPVLLICLPLLAAIISFAMVKHPMARIIALCASSATVVLTLVSIRFHYFDAHLRYLEFNKNLFGEAGLNINLLFGDIGFSLVVLTNIIFAILFIFADVPENKKSSMFYGLLLLIQSGLNGVFMSQNIFWFYLFFEMGLVPAYLLIGVWGTGENKAKTSFQFFVYTLFGSLIMLAAIIYLVMCTGITKATDFGNIFLFSAKLDLQTQLQLAGMFLLAFMIKMPIVPFHTWQANTYKAAPTTVTIVLSALMAKMGLYGVIRILIQALPLAFMHLQPYMIVFGIVGIIYTAIIAIKQDDLKKLLAYSSISHISLMFIGVFSYTLGGMKGVIFQMFNHGVIVAGLLICVEYIHHRTNTYTISNLGGLAIRAPKLAVCFLIFVMASIGLPLTNGFVGELLILRSIFTYNPWMSAAAALTIILGAVYMLRMYQYVMLGENNVNTDQVTDLNMQELLVLSPLIIIILLFGIYPNAFLGIMF